ncbi:MAG: hypothetical protein KDB37_05535 [Ilumatobacter sp.]|nr:hypothetical protein [Ilumatobacter sp.]
MTSIDDVLAVAEAPGHQATATARILLRQDLVAEHARLDAELQQAIADDARLNRNPVAPGLARQIEELEGRLEGERTEFLFRSIGKRAWADLLAAHPPTKRQVERNKGLDHNPDTFPAAAIAASCVSPEMTLDQVRRLEQALNNSQFDALWARCLEANLGGVALPKSLTVGMIRRANVPSATTAASEASPGASSSGE